MRKVLMAAVAVGMVGAAGAAVVFDAAVENTTVFNNAYNGTDANASLSGATPDLVLASDGGNFYVAGFASTENINALTGGVALTDQETVTMSLTVDSITHTDSAQLRSRGFECGISADATISGGGSAENFILRVGGAGNGSVMQLVDNSFGVITSSVFRATTASVEDGFAVTLAANEAGFTFSFTGLEAVDGVGSGIAADISGTFEDGEFASNFGGGHFYSAVQKRYAGTTSVDYGVASLEVIPEPASFGLVVAMGGSLLAIRRMFRI